MDALAALWREMTGDDPPPVTFLGDEHVLPGPYRVAHAAAVCVAATTLAAGGDPIVHIGHAAEAFRSERHLRAPGGPADLWAPLSGDYRTSDGWVRLHANYPHHAEAIVRALGVPPDEVRAEVSRRRAVEVENAVIEAGGAAAAMRTRDEWLTYGPGATIRTEPLIAIERIADAPTGSAALAAGSRSPAGGSTRDETRSRLGDSVGAEKRIHGLSAVDSARAQGKNESTGSARDAALASGPRSPAYGPAPTIPVDGSTRDSDALRTPLDGDKDSLGDARVQDTSLASADDHDPGPASGPRFPAYGTAPTVPARPLRVLDLTHVIAGPVCGRVLAAHGAHVLHVGAPHLPTLDQLVMDTGFGKRSCHLDLRHHPHRLRELVAQADVFVQSYRPGSLAAKGFGPAEVASVNPGIVVVSLAAYGHTGLWRGRRGFDSLVQMSCGIAAGTDTPRPLPVQALDHATGWLAAFGTLVARRRQAAEGGSWHVRLSLARTAEWLHDLGRDDTTSRPVDVTPFLDETDSDFGRLAHIRVPGARIRPAGPRRPGRDPATWW